MEPGRTSTASLVDGAPLGACRITILVACLQKVLIDERNTRAIDFPAATMAFAFDDPITSFARNVGSLGASAAGFTNRPNSPSKGRRLHPSLDAAET